MSSEENKMMMMMIIRLVVDDDCTDKRYITAGQEQNGNKTKRR